VLILIGEHFIETTLACGNRVAGCTGTDCGVRSRLHHNLMLDIEIHC